MGLQSMFYLGARIAIPNKTFPRMPCHVSTTRLLTLMWLAMNMISAWISGPVPPSGRTWVKSVTRNRGRLVRTGTGIYLHATTTKYSLSNEDHVDGSSSNVYAGNNLQNIIIAPISPNYEEPDTFIEEFRMAAPFLQAHRGELFVIHITGKVSASSLALPLLDDIAMLFMLGVKVVLVIGSTHQEVKIHLEKGIPYTVAAEYPITSNASLSIAMEAAGLVQFQIISRMSHGHLPGINKIGVSSGNYYTASPVGIRGGVDYMYSGVTRRINIEKIKRRVTEDVVLLSSIGFSSSGEAYRVQTEELASVCAAQLRAAKLIYVTDGQMIMAGKGGQGSVPVVSLTLPEAKRIHRGMICSVPPQNGCRLEVTPQVLNGEELVNYTMKYGNTLGHCIDAVSLGVNRAHVVSPCDGKLLKELFTPVGSGLLVTKNIYDGFRSAKESDFQDIVDIMAPLMETGELKERSLQDIKDLLKHFTVAIRDEKLVACAMLKEYSLDHAEIGCVAVSPLARHKGLGEALLGYLERIAYASGLKYCIVLSTSTMTWFMERGYEQFPLNELPTVHQELYNWKRKSKVVVVH